MRNECVFFSFFEYFTGKCFGCVNFDHWSISYLIFYKIKLFVSLKQFLNCLLCVLIEKILQKHYKSVDLVCWLKENVTKNVQLPLLSYCYIVHVQRKQLIDIVITTLNDSRLRPTPNGPNFSPLSFCFRWISSMMICWIFGGKTFHLISYSISANPLSCKWRTCTCRI